MLVTRGVEAMQQVLGWDTAKTTALLQACEAELSTRLQQIQAMRYISSTHLDSSRQPSATSTKEGAETPTQGST